MFKMTDYSSPQEKDITKQTVFNTSIKRMTEHNFVQSFKSNFTNNGAFENVSSAEEIYRILKNIDEDLIKERYEFALLGTQGKTASVKNAKVKSLLERAQKLRLNGGNQVVTLNDFIHVPGLEGVDVNKIPDNV